MLTPAPLETARFGLRAFRAAPESVDAAGLFEEIRRLGADLVILRVPPATASAVRGLARYGVAPIHADTLVAYRCNLRDIAPGPAVEDGFSIDDAQDDDREAIGELVDAVFERYPSHYTANPLLSREAVVAGYREWALSHLQGDHRIAWVARAGGRIAAIACSAFDPATGECQGVLHGVHPDFARGGIYTALIRHTQVHFRKLGCMTLGIQTQAWNVPVQRMWAREGFALAEVRETFHVNALMDPSHGVIANTTLRFADVMPHDIETIILRATSEIVDPAAPPARRGPDSSATVAVFGRIRAGEAHSLQVRLYDFSHSCGRRIAVGTLYGADRLPCALARLTLEATS